MLYHLEEQETPQLQAPLFYKTQKNPFVPQKTETQNHAQKPHPTLSPSGIHAQTHGQSTCQPCVLCSLKC